jgi:ubiquitin carboxyl-terminal hydrolase 8
MTRTNAAAEQAIFAPTPPNGSPATPIQYPPSGLNSSQAIFGPFSRPQVSLPPQASVNPMPSRRWNESADQSQESLPPVLSRRPVDYPDLSSQHLIRLPPAAVTPPRERQDSRPVVRSRGSLKPPMIESDYPVTYWSDLPISTSGLKNLGNTCYMNATIQCLSASIPFARFFTGEWVNTMYLVFISSLLVVDGRWKSGVNMVNPLGSKGSLAQGFATLLHELWHGEIAYFAPYSFRVRGCHSKSNPPTTEYVSSVYRRLSAMLHRNLEGLISTILKSSSLFCSMDFTRISIVYCTKLSR